LKVQILVILHIGVILFQFLDIVPSVLAWILRIFVGCWADTQSLVVTGVKAGASLTT
jgi:hypothetical protein